MKNPGLMQLCSDFQIRVGIASISLKVSACMLSRFTHVQFFVIPWTVAC